MIEPDWTHWRSFAAVVEHGSLSGAARHLGMTQPTMGRHIEELERTLGVTLFDRTLQGLKPTETGLRLYEPIRAAQQSLAQATLMAEGTHEDLNGSIRITSSSLCAAAHAFGAAAGLSGDRHRTGVVRLGREPPAARGRHCHPDVPADAT